MTEETKKPEELTVAVVVPPTYRDRIDGLLKRVSKGEEIYPKPPAKPEPTTYDKMKEMGGTKKGLVELFKMEESAFDVPHYVNEDEETEIPGTKLHRVSPPSSHADADEYWARISPHLKRIGKVVPHEGEKPGSLEMEVVNPKGETETLKVQLVRDEAHGEKPTLVFEYVNKDNLTADEAIRLVEKSGLKVSRLETKQIKGIVILDALDK